MLKKTITYVDFNDVETTEDFYFNLSKTELTEMETSVKGGLSAMLKQIVATEDMKEMFGIFKKIIVSSVGIKSADGKRFVKSDEISQDFVSSPAFDELFMSLATDVGKAAEFIKGIIPKDLSGQFESEMNKSNVVEIPTTES